MNIAIVTTWFERGAAYVSKAYMDSLQSQGHKVHVYARGGECYATGDPVWDLPNVTWSRQYHPWSRFTRFGWQYIDMGHFENWLRVNDVEVVLFNEEHRFETVERTRSLGYNVGAYIDYYKKSTVPGFRAYDFLLCNTKRHHSVFSEFPNCFYIPWGTDTKLFKPKSDRSAKSPGDPVVFFHSAGWGGVNLRKGTDLLLKAFRQVQGNAKLIVQSQSPLANYGKEAIENIKEDERIEFLEKTVAAPGLYHLGDVFVYPSRLEGIGLCVPEALACGLPVITTDCAPMNEFVQEGVNGSLVRVNKQRTREDGYYWPESIVDIESLTGKMQAYVEEKSKLSQYQKQAREYAKENLDWMKNASGLGGDLQGLLDEGDRRRRPKLSERLPWWLEAKYVAMLTHIERIRKVARACLQKS